MTRLDALFREVAGEQDALRARSPIRERLVARVRDGAKPKSRPRVSWTLAAAAALAVVGVITAVVVSRSVLGVRVGESGSPPLVGAWLDASDRKPLSLEFSDGSRFDLAPKAKVRLVELERRGARVELASGSMKVAVVPHQVAEYRLDAGPFRVRVTGTRFELSYSPESDTFELFLEEGQVELSGCAFGHGRKLAAGQNVKATCKKPSVSVGFGPRSSKSHEVEAPTGAPESGGSPARAAQPPKPSERGSEPGAPRVVSSGPSGKTSESSWLALARAGSYEQAFSVVHARGFEAECATASSDALGLLADVARHAGAPRQAEHALLTLRRRFNGTNESALAAFSLGRLHFDEYQAYPRAASWFKTYLSERPSGAMTREALGRLMEAHYRAQDLAAARAVAARYLREYPSGPHAELASRVVASP
jgi:TolA-binding protein